MQHLLLDAVNGIQGPRYYARLHSTSARIVLEMFDEHMTKIGEVALANTDGDVMVYVYTGEDLAADTSPSFQAKVY